MTARLVYLREWLAWRLQRMPVRHAAVWLLCVAACAVMAYRASTLRAEVDHLRSQRAYQAQARAAGSARQPVDARAAFFAFFPRQDPVEGFLQRFYARADQGGLLVTRASIEEVPPPLPGLKRQNIHISLEAHDDHYRELVYRLLQEFPAMTLNRMSVRRTDTEGFQVELIWGAVSR